MGTSARGTEVVIALVGALGTPLRDIAEQLRRALETVDYQATTISVSSLLAELPKLPAKIDRTSEDTRVETSMDAGNKLREVTKRADALAVMAMLDVRRDRGVSDTTARRCYIVRSLKNPVEVAALARVYRERFVLIGVYMPRDLRLDRLSEVFAASHGKRREDMRARGELLIARDESERENKWGQNVRDAFPLADVFIDARSPAEVTRGLQRFVSIFFARPCVTPVADECGMFHAQAAAMRSAALGRQVGAAITTPDGDLIALGVNEVPKGGGGHYWGDDLADARDFAIGHDQSDRQKQAVIREVMLLLQREKALSVELAELEPDDLSSRGRELLRGSSLTNLTEFGRDVHAEMSAITASARTGVSVRGCTLFCTTFPCHSCARHIVASGIARVVYIEPYAKSFARQFHADSIAAEGNGGIARPVRGHRSEAISRVVSCRQTKERRRPRERMAATERAASIRRSPVWGH
jgi:deoxycytidylate deaminase